jgi:excisionase family DNA binding protein
MDNLLTKKDVAIILEVSVKAIDKWVYAGKIPYVKISRKCVRFKQADVEQFLANRTVQVIPNPPGKKGRPRKRL